MNVILDHIQNKMQTGDCVYLMYKKRWTETEQPK